MNILDAFDSFGIEYRQHSSKENEYYVCCPFCEEQGESPDTRFRLGINVVEGKLHCFNCDKKSSNPEYTWKELERALETGALEAASKVARRTEKKPVSLPPDFTPVTYKRTDDHWNEVALRYLHTRNVSTRQIEQKGIGYSTVGDFRYRVIVPVFYQGKLEGIVARAFVVGLEPKYKNSVGQKVIYNIPENPKDTIVLTEGVFDALAIEKAVRPRMDSGAVLGHSLTERQLEQLGPYSTVILWPDPDEAGIKGFCKMATQLQDAKKKVQIILPDIDQEEYDPSELWPDEIKVKMTSRIDFSSDVVYRMKAALAFRED